MGAEVLTLMLIVRFVLPITILLSVGTLFENRKTA
jgi:hypothetical protein